MQTKIVSEEQVRKLKLNDVLAHFPNVGKPQEEFNLLDPENYTLYSIVNIVPGVAHSKFHLKSEHENAASQFMPGSKGEIRNMLIKSGKALVIEKVWWLVT